MDEEVREMPNIPTLLLGIDIGNKYSKSSHYVIQSGVVKLATEPAITYQVLTFDGQYYKVGAVKNTIQGDKYESENVRISTFALIAKELKKRGLHAARIRLAVGVPLTRIGAERMLYSTYMKQVPVAHFKYEQDEFDIEIISVDVFPQGYSGSLAADIEYTPGTVLVDLGSWTADIIRFEGKHPDASNCFSLDMGVITVIQSVQEALRQKYNDTVDDEIIKEIMMTGSTKSLTKEYLRTIQDLLAAYSRSIIDELRSLKISSTGNNLIFIGGGALLMKNFCQDKKINYIIDINLNAKGYESLLRQKYMRKES